VRVVHLLAPTQQRGDAVVLALAGYAKAEGVTEFKVITTADRLLGCHNPEVWVMSSCSLLERVKARSEVGLRGGSVLIVSEKRVHDEGRP